VSDDDDIRDELETITELIALEVEAACGSLLGHCCSAALGLVHLAMENETTRPAASQLALVEGSYGQDAHWWVEYGAEIYDPTHDQFTHPGPYRPSRRWSAFESGGELARLRARAADELYAWAAEGDWDVDNLAAWLGLDGQPRTFNI
jgi:hypothetical protein